MFFLTCFQTLEQVLHDIVFGVPAAIYVEKVKNIRDNIYAHIGSTPTL